MEVAYAEVAMVTKSPSHVDLFCWFGYVEHCSLREQNNQKRHQVSHVQGYAARRDGMTPCPHGIPFIHSQRAPQH